MTEHGFALFDTRIGWCGLAWGADGIVRTWLPERDAAATRARIRRRLPEAVETIPPPAMQLAVEGITALLTGDSVDLGFVPLDMAGVPDFERRVYAIARTIMPGQTMTYGEIAGRVGRDGDARMVGQAMARNPFPIVVPCHRVLAAGGKPGGFSAPGGVETKFRLLAIEGGLRQLTLFDGVPG
jgi:methylated-DNA-[protein]-cysteine S-methyltransferase